MELETQGWFSICSDRSGYHLHFFSVAVKPYRGDLTVFQRTPSTSLSHKVRQCVEKQRVEEPAPARAAETPCSHSVPAIQKWSWSTFLHLGKQLPLLLPALWVRETNIHLQRHFSHDAQGSAVHLQPGAAPYSGRSEVLQSHEMLWNLFLWRNKKLLARKTENMRTPKNPNLNVFINRIYKVSYLIEIELYLWFQ